MQKLFRWASKWWPGLIPLALMWGIAAWNNTLPVEADLSARSAAALEDTVLDKTRIAVDGRDVSLAADAFSEEGRRDAVTAGGKVSRGGFGGGPPRPVAQAH